MPKDKAHIEIVELLVKVIVEDKEVNDALDKKMGKGFTSEDKEAIIQECMQRMEEQMRINRER